MIRRKTKGLWQELGIILGVSYSQVLCYVKTRRGLMTASLLVTKETESTLVVLGNCGK